MQNNHSNYNKYNVIISVFIIFSLILISGCELNQDEEQINIANNDQNTNQQISNDGINSNQQTNVVVKNTNINQKVKITQFETDKEVYSSYQDITFSLSALSIEEIENVQIQINGIKPYNNNYIQIQQYVNLIKGNNEFTFTAKTPYCTSGCGGVYPGPYQINITVIKDQELLSESDLIINLEKQIN